MSTTITRSMWLRLYKNLYKEATKFSTYNYREYAKRRVRDHFRGKISEQEPAKLASLYEFGTRELTSLKRQTILVKLYAAPKLVIEDPIEAEKLVDELSKVGGSTRA